MTSSTTNARIAGSDSMIKSDGHIFPWKWYLKDLKDVPQNGLNVFSCFACGGGSSMGYKLAGYHMLGNCEIDRDMHKIYGLNHNPPYSYLMDVRDFLAIPNEQLPEELLSLDILDGSPPCFVAGTKVKTDKGYKNIEDVSVGDYVYTHKNHYRKVNNVMSKVSEEIYSLKIQGALPIFVTGNHPFYVRTMNRAGHFEARSFGEPHWQSAKDLVLRKRKCGTVKEQDYVAIPVNMEERYPKWDGVEVDHCIYGKKTVKETKCSIDVKSNDFWFFVGRYLGDGWRRKDRKEVIICCAKNEKDELFEIVRKAGFNGTLSEEKTTFRLTISSVELFYFLEKFRDGAANKIICDEALDLPVDKLKSLIEGYESADGHYYENRGVCGISSVSYDLILSLQAAIAKVYHQPTTITIKRNRGKLLGRDVMMRTAYDLRYRKNECKQQHSFYEDGYVWVPFRSVEKCDCVDAVYNLSVDEDESYTVYNLAVHNCSVFSMAGERDKGWGKEKVFREGQKKQTLDDLFFVFINIAKKLQPKVVVAENVKGLVTGQAKGYVNEIFKAFRDAGYIPQLFLLNAAYMGVPQARERVFFVAQRKDLKKPKLQLSFNEPLIPFRDVRSDEGVLVTGEKLQVLMENRKDSDRTLADINKRMFGKDVGFTNCIWHDNRVCGTIASGGTYFRMYDGMKMSDADFINVQSFPQDYNFVDQSPQYVCGMSVPPVMMAQIARQIWLQWFKN